MLAGRHARFRNIEGAHREWKPRGSLSSEDEEVAGPAPGPQAQDDLPHGHVRGIAGVVGIRRAIAEWPRRDAAGHPADIRRLVDQDGALLLGLAAEHADAGAVMAAWAQLLNGAVAGL